VHFFFQVISKKNRKVIFMPKMVNNSVVNVPFYQEVMYIYVIIFMIYGINVIFIEAQIWCPS